MKIHSFFFLCVLLLSTSLPFISSKPTTTRTTTRSSSSSRMVEMSSFSSPTRTRSSVSSLQSYNVDIQKTSVSGLSSGGFFSVQMQVTYSSIMVGAGIFAGGPYHCAEGSVSTAETKCMYATSAPNVNPLISITNSRAASHLVDNTSYLGSHKVFMFSGTKDDTVKQPVMDALQTYYKNYLPASSIVYINNIAAAHTQPTDDPANTNKCSTSKSPYLSDCDYDGAGKALEQIYGTLAARNDGTPSGTMLEFDQTEFIVGYSMAPTGYVYVPKTCADMQPCVLHVSFHGCVQNFDTVGDAYINHSGYNKWADTNNFIILYPQTVKSNSHPDNPNACWDWWGYNNPNTYDTNAGEQEMAVRKMIDRITGGVVDILPPTSLSVTGVTNSTVSLSWVASVTQGVTYNLYRNNIYLNTGSILGTTYTDTGLLSGTEYAYYLRSAIGTDLSDPSNAVQTTTLGAPPPLGAPQNLVVSLVTSSSVSITWSIVDGASEYNVYRNGTFDSSTSVPTCADDGLSSSTVYEYVIHAVNSMGEGPASAPLDVMTLSGFVCTSYKSSNYDHVKAGRAYDKFGSAYAVGSDEYMGLDNTFYTTTLAETSTDYYVIGHCPADGR